MLGGLSGDALVRPINPYRMLFLWSIVSAGLGVNRLVLTSP